MVQRGGRGNERRGYVRCIAGKVPAEGLRVERPVSSKCVLTSSIVWKFNAPC